MGGSLIPKEYMIIGSTIQQINGNYVVYLDNDKYRTLYFADDILDYCCDILCRIKDKFIYRTIIYYDNTILAIEDKEDNLIVIHVSECLEEKNGIFFVKQ